MKTNQRIVIVEPSPFRRDETYVLGPYGRFVAWLTANLVVSKLPFSMVQVVPAMTKVTIGKRVLWDHGEPESTENRGES